MKAVATKRGFYKKIREPGDSFDVEPGVTGSWFAVETDSDVKQKEAKPDVKQKEAKTEV